MIHPLRGLTRRGVMNPVARAAIATWVWNYRHEILRWGRSLWNEALSQRAVDPARAVRTGRVLMAIAAEDQLRNAPQLRRVTMHGDIVDLDVEPGWRDLPRVVEKVGRVKGVAGVTVNGAELTVVSTTGATP